MRDSIVVEVEVRLQANNVALELCAALLAELIELVAALDGEVVVDVEEAWVHVLESKLLLESKRFVRWS